MGWRGVDDVRYRERWFCYLDLLGFSTLVTSSAIHQIIPTYEGVIRELRGQARAKREHGVSSAWFSDTFILYSRHGSDSDFAAVESAGRLFFQQLVMKGIPVRGALAFGKLYSRARKNVFVGPVLVEAYNYAERQNWIGFILTPSAFERCQGTQIDLNNRLNYRPLPNDQILRGLPAAKVYAYTFSNGGASGTQAFLRRVAAMRYAAGPLYKEKYDNTETFIRLHAR